MSWLLSRVVGFFGVSPHQLLIIAATCAMAFTIGLAYGNHWATARAIEATAQAVNAARDAELARYTTALQEHAERVSEELAALAAANYLAAQEAHRNFQAERERAAKDRAKVIVVLNKEKEISDGLRRVNEILAGEKPPAAECALSASVREALDNASGARQSADDQGAAAVAPGGANGEATLPTTFTAVTCFQLAEGYAALGEHDRLVIAQLSSLQQWVNDILVVGR